VPFHKYHGELAGFAAYKKYVSARAVSPVTLDPEVKTDSAGVARFCIWIYSLRVHRFVYLAKLLSSNAVLRN